MVTSHPATHPTLPLSVVDDNVTHLQKVRTVHIRDTLQVEKSNSPGASSASHELSNGLANLEDSLAGLSVTETLCAAYQPSPPALSEGSSPTQPQMTTHPSEELHDHLSHEDHDLSIYRMSWIRALNDAAPDHASQLRAAIKKHWASPLVPRLCRILEVEARSSKPGFSQAVFEAQRHRRSTL